MFRLLLVLFLLPASCFAIDKERQDQNAPLVSWLELHDRYRVASLTDCNCLETLKHIGREVSGAFNPYSVSADFDRDGKEDFAQVVAAGENPKDFRILVFLSSMKEGRLPLVYGNIFNSTLDGLGLFSLPAETGGSILLFGAFGSEAEPIHLPISIP